MKVVFDEIFFDEIDHCHPNFDESVLNLQHHYNTTTQQQHNNNTTTTLENDRNLKNKSLAQSHLG